MVCRAVLKGVIDTYRRKNENEIFFFFLFIHFKYNGFSLVFLLLLCPLLLAWAPPWEEDCCTSPPHRHVLCVCCSPEYQAVEKYSIPNVYSDGS